MMHRECPLGSMQQTATVMNKKITYPKEQLSQFPYHFRKPLQYFSKYPLGAENPPLLPELVSKSQSLSLPLSFPPSSSFLSFPFASMRFLEDIINNPVSFKPG